MKYIILIIILITQFIEVYAQCSGVSRVAVIQGYSQCSSDKWVMVFKDEFDEKSLDLLKWEPVEGIPRDLDFTEQKAYHKPENIVLEDGKLKIISKREMLTNVSYVYSWKPYVVKTTDFGYTTGEIWTKSKFSYGKYEASIKIPNGKGFFPAFWTYADNPWNEIDILEFNSSNVHEMTTHHDYDNDGNKTSCHSEYTGVDFSQAFHTFTLIYEKDNIEWYVDGYLKRRDCKLLQIDGGNTGCYLAAASYHKRLVYPDKPMQIVINTAIHHNTNEPDASTIFPNQMEVEWVRYYKRTPNACQDVSITNALQFPLSTQVFNGIVGKDVSINCPFTIPSGQQLDIVAGNSVTLGPGFSAEFGSEFLARIENTVCY